MCLARSFTWTRAEEGLPFSRSVASHVSDSGLGGWFESRRAQWMMEAYSLTVMWVSLMLMRRMMLFGMTMKLLPLQGYHQVQEKATLEWWQWWVGYAKKYLPGAFCFLNSHVQLCKQFCWIFLLQRRRSRWETKGKTNEMISFSVHMSVIIILVKNGIRKQNNSWGILGKKMQQNKHLCKQVNIFKMFLNIKRLSNLEQESVTCYL